MRNGPVVGVLSPFVGGTYFGDLLAGIARTASSHDSTIVAVQTLDAGSYMADVQQFPDFAPPVAWDHLHGFIAIVDAVPRKHLARIERTGRPVVQIAHQYPEHPCPAVLADNGAGVREAVRHLITHGHERIAFAGYLSVTDVRERYEAYVETLLEHGLRPDPALLYRTTDSLEAAGADVGRRMLAAGLPSTAVVCGTDLNAMGIMRTLRAHGHQVPDDQAIVGFDDSYAAAYLTPSLSSVRQLLDVMGRTAFELVLQALDGTPLGLEPVRVPTTFVPRASCGCVPTGAPGGSRDEPQSPESRLRQRLGTLLPASSEALRAEKTAIVTAAQAIAVAVRAAATGAPTPDWQPTGAALLDLYAIKRQPETLAVILQAIQAFADDIAPAATNDAVIVHRVAAAVQHLMLLVAHAQGALYFADNSHYRTTVSAQYEVTMDLLHSDVDDPHDLKWLARTSARGGCLGLWVPPPTTHELDIVGTVGPDHLRATTVAPVPVSAFPPADLFSLVSGPEDVVFVVPAKVNASDWGLLAVVDQVETRVQNGRESLNQCAALLTVALDQRRHERRLRQAALYDPLTGLANRSLFTEHLSHAAGRAKRQARYRLAVLFLDLDGFKTVNDTLGHSVGDRVLMWVAERIMECLRETDTAARFGGDEFLILLDDIGDPGNATAIADRLESVLSAPLHLDGHDVLIGASIGIAMSDMQYESAEDILRCADEAMYRVKSTRNALPNARALMPAHQRQN